MAYLKIKSLGGLLGASIIHHLIANVTINAYTMNPLMVEYRKKTTKSTVISKSEKIIQMKSLQSCMSGRAWAEVTLKFQAEFGPKIRSLKINTHQQSNEKINNLKS